MAPDPKQTTDRPEVEQPDDARGAHNRIGFLDTDESDTSSERGGEERDVAEEMGDRDA